MRCNILSTTYPGGGIETFTYNAANNVITSTDRKGVTTTYTYNLFGKPTGITAGGKTKSYTYASNGSVLTETSEAGTISYTYDELGRKVSETTGGKTTNYTYDRAGNVLTTAVGSFSTSYTYDALNRVISASNAHSGVNYTYNTAGQRVSTTVKRSDTTISQTTYAYNYAGAITSQINRNANGDILSQFTYTYDIMGDVLTAYDSTTGQTANYTYDALGRLISETKGGTSRYYTYDEAGNRTKAIVDTANTIVYTYDSDGRLISETLNNGQTSTTTSYTYDANGNLASKTANNVTTTYTFDVWGNMTSANGATYTYNVQGLRIAKTIGNKAYHFQLVNGRILSINTYEYYLLGYEIVGNGSTYYLYNAHGDVIQLLNSNGEVTKTYNYDAYGNELTRDQNDPNPFRYCGEYYDTETGFIYLRARYYNPSVGRFISVDPAKDGLNWYAYCGDNPVVYVDPWGLKLRDLSPQATVMNYDDVGGAATTSPAKTSADAGKSVASTGTKYDRDAAINYAKEYAYGWNQNYMKMDDWGFKAEYFLMYGKRSGNDCANFVSQCLEAGGIKQNDDWYYNRVINEPLSNSSFAVPEVNIPLFTDKNGNTTHRWCDYSFSSIWTGAKSQYEYFSNIDNGYAVDEIVIRSVNDISFALENYNIQKGDLLYFENKKGIHHATIISSVTDDNILYAAHTSSRFNEKLSEHLGKETCHIIILKDYY